MRVIPIYSGCEQPHENKAGSGSNLHVYSTLIMTSNNFYVPIAVFSVCLCEFKHEK